MQIDAVISWVDGNDPVLNAKRAQYTQGTTLTEQEDVAGATRYDDRGEIHWCVRSINKFAPWIRRIFIVTDGQDPHVQSQIPVQVVDHHEVFRGYEQYLPTFNSNSIATMMWQIPGLSEHFIYFNDDILLTTPVQPQDFFRDEQTPINYGRNAVTWWTRLRYAIKPYIMHLERVNPCHQMLNSVEMVGGSYRFPRTVHAPRAFLRSVYGEFYQTHPEALVRNLQYKFRDIDQFRPDTLCFLLLMQRGHMEMRSPRGVVLEYYPTGGMERLQRKLRPFVEGRSTYRFANFGSLDKTTPEMFNYLRSVIEKILE